MRYEFVGLKTKLEGNYLWLIVELKFISKKAISQVDPLKGSRRSFQGKRETDIVEEPEFFMFKFNDLSALSKALIVIASAFKAGDPIPSAFNAEGEDLSMDYEEAEAYLWMLEVKN